MRTLGLLIALAVAGCMTVGSDPENTGGGGGEGGFGGGFGGGSGGGSGGGGGGGSTSATPAEVMTKMTKVDCDQAFSCKASFPTGQGVTFQQVFGANATECYAKLADEYYDATAIQASIAANKITYDATEGARCVTEIAAMLPPVCGTYWQNGADFPDPCYDAMVGHVADGAACANDWECGENSWCGETDVCVAF